MPKRVNNLYKKMLDTDAIEAAIWKSSRGKRKRAEVKKVLEDVPGTARNIKILLEAGMYIPTPPKVKTIIDSSSLKERRIKIVPFYPDGIIQQLAVDVMRDVLMRSMDYWSCASIPGRGNMHAIRYVKRSLRKDKKRTKYCAKLDIHHYYASINVDTLMRQFERKIKDKEFLDLIEAIFRSDPDGGLSIGYYINQWAANFYLQKLDRYIRTLDGVCYYVRNMDDMVILGPNKRKLHRAVDRISDFMGLGLDLELKDNWQVFPVDSRGIDFVGYRFYHGRTTLRRRNFLKLTRTCRKVLKKQQAGKPVSYHLAAGFLARAGHLKHCDSQMIREKYLSPVKLKPVKDVIRRESLERLKLQDPAGHPEAGELSPREKMA